MTGARIALPLALAVALGVAVLTIVPRGVESESLLAAQDDPAALARPPGLCSQVYEAYVCET